MRRTRFYGKAASSPLKCEHCGSTQTWDEEGSKPYRHESVLEDVICRKCGMTTDKD